MLTSWEEWTLPSAPTVAGSLTLGVAAGITSDFRTCYRLALLLKSMLDWRVWSKFSLCTCLLANWF